MKTVKKKNTQWVSEVERMFGVNVFGFAAMRRCLSAAVMGKLETLAATGGMLDAATAEAVAIVMREWALKRGATHFAHVFYPLSGQTAEKHDSLFALGGEGELISIFNGRSLTGGESDGSSFPSGGLRTTFEARGITRWDVRCPPYLVVNPDDGADVVLAIPSVFSTAAGEALDEKTPLARSGRALAAQAERVLSLLGVKEGAVYANAGVEQEYFLVDREFVRQRPDLAICSRTLLGARPPKGQEFADQYFGAIPERVKAYMLDFERELWRLGIAAQTRHNETAPGQYEFVPCFERDFMASDHNQIVMQVMQRVAEQHGMTCLLHEKPFAGVNGSGKHVNWSVHTEKRNLFKGGETPSENVPFILFTAALVRAVHRYSRLLRSVVAGSGNDLRLGAHEAPPAIMSIFLGESLTDFFENVATGAEAASSSSGDDDRNRTSPFAYTGNKFEFRAVGASQPVSAVLTVLNTILAESLDEAAAALEKELENTKNTGGLRIRKHDCATLAALRVAGAFYREHKAVVFNGDGYSEAWRVEAKRRGLPEITNSVDAYAAFNAPENVALFEKYGVMTAREVNGRAEVYMDRYVKQIATESAVCLAMTEQQVLPAIYRYQGELATTAAMMTQAGVEPHTGQLRKVTALARTLEEAVEALRETIAHRPEGDDLQAQAAYCRDKVLPAMATVRQGADAVETVVAEDLWRLPKYREMLFVK